MLSRPFLTTRGSRAQRSAATRGSRPLSQHAPLRRRRPGSCRRRPPAGSRNRSRAGDRSCPGGRSPAEGSSEGSSEDTVEYPAHRGSVWARPPSVYDLVLGVCKCWVRGSVGPAPPSPGSAEALRPRDYEGSRVFFKGGVFAGRGWSWGQKQSRLCRFAVRVRRRGPRDPPPPGALNSTLDILVSVHS